MAVYGIPFRDALQMEPLSSTRYRTSIHVDYCNGPIASGGFVASIIHRCVSEHFRTALAERKQPDTMTLHMEFLKRTLAGETTLEVRNVRLGANTSTIHISMFQGGSEKAAAYATNTNMSDEKGVTYPTEYMLSPEPCSTDTVKLLKNQDPLWISFYNRYDHTSFAKARTHWKFFLPISGPPHPSITDEWVTPIRPGERFTNDILCFIADRWTHMCENFRPGSPYSAAEIIQRAKKQGPASKPRLPTPNEWQTPFYYPTLLISLEFKKLLPPEGVDLLFLRARAKQIKNGRFDVEVTIMDTGGELVVIANHVAFIVANKGFTNVEDSGLEGRKTSKL